MEYHRSSSVKRLMKKSQKFQVKWLQKDKSTFAICFVFDWMIPVDLSRYTLNLYMFHAWEQGNPVVHYSVV